MNKLKHTLSVFLLLCCSLLVKAQTNVATQATATTSYVSSWETITALNDNFTPANSNDKSHGAYGNWNNPNSLQWVQYDWAQTYAVTSIQVYWFNDGGGVLTPTTAYAERWSGTAWVSLGNIPLQTNAFNTLSFASVNLSRIRVTMRNTTQSTGILEWRVMGTVVGGGGTGDPYTWPSYSPTISYNFRDEFPSLPTPANVLNDCPQVVGTQSSQWWTFRWGPNKNSLVTTAAITPLLSRMNTDFAYFRDQMGWPPDLRAKNGYRSAVYLYGSGLCTDNAPNTALGGWQSAINYNGTSWPMVLASYYPIYSYDPACPYSDREFQKSAMVHEGIHSVLADLPGVKQSAWFHEGGNVWLQQTADARRSGNFSSMGDLNGTDFIAPFMPIECYSGWLQDGSFGGPSAEGVNRYNSSGQQLCTWRTFLGGHQYSSSFPTFLGNVLGDGAVPWIWRNAPSRVLQGIASGIGATQMRRLISEYRAKQALVDFGPWKNAILALLNAHFGQSIGAEWQPSWLNPAVWTATPYVQTTNNAGLLTPEARTLPGWSGANQIPLNVTGNMVTVNFEPIGANMTCQLVYRSTTGVPVYSQIVSSGSCSLRLDTPPASGVVIAVITNTDYIYNGESTRTAHYDYRLRLVTGVTGTANINTKWYNSATLAARTTGGDETGTVGIDMGKYCTHSYHNTREVAEVKRIINPGKFLMYPNPVAVNKAVMLEFTNAEKEKTVITIVSLQGVKVFETATTGNNYIIDPKNLASGSYIVRVQNGKTNTTQKLLVSEP